MEYWTVLWVTVLSGPLDGSTSGLIYPTLAACEAATTTISGTLPYDHSIACNTTDIMSASIRPKRNPTYTEN